MIARSANRLVRYSMCGVKRAVLSGPVKIPSGVSLAHRYSWEPSRCRGGRGSHKTRRDGGGSIREHCAKLLTRLYRNVPAASVSVNWPSWA
ncbi:MAG: hypothetical protein JWM19_2226 [Actinomycetia bacterium]|nr:hypothetical protein [Actinomycetes bacterium]